MYSNKFERILKCPLTHAELRILTENELKAINLRIQQGEMTQYNKEIFQRPLQGALKVQYHDLYYPVQEGIYCLLKQNAIFGKFAVNNEVIDATKSQVKQFYDDIGWQQNNGVYQDAKDSEDLRTISDEYIQRCHQRLNKFIPKSGEYLLDIASGPIQYPAYLTYSENFEYRICADISWQALLEAKTKLGKKGRYLLCDVTNLPIKDNTIDAQVSLHTIYHVPALEQAMAFSELYRVLKPGGASVVVYSWGARSLLMNLLMLPFKAASKLKRTIKMTKANSLYFYTHSFQWFCQEIQPKYQTQLYPWRSVNVPFLKLYIHGLPGRWLLRFIYAMEERFPKLMGRIGAYPLFVSKK
ncbi:MAG: class I SAM-dependent methyltransferase [Proteobacteria bacterium]|nr:class I SAM-dependent methyltransferase [Pseudomonadota bacterium]